MGNAEWTDGGGSLVARGSVAVVVVEKTTSASSVNAEGKINSCATSAQKQTLLQDFMSFNLAVETHSTILSYITDKGTS